MPPNPGKIRMVGNGEPINGCMIHRVTKYSGFRDLCGRFSVPALPFRQNIVIIQIGLNYEFSTSVAGCSIRIDRTMKMSIFSMCMMAIFY